MIVNKTASFIVRSLYLLVMYSGMRAGTNRVRSLFLPALHASAIDGAILQVDGSSTVQVRVHARPCVRISGETRNCGMISVSLKDPRLPRMLYSLMRLSSHFGCGHVELAFYENGNGVCVFAVRNMLRSNLDRIGFGSSLGKLPLWNERDEIAILAHVLNELREQKLDARLSSPEESVRLAVSRWLLNPKTRERSLAALTRRYQRITDRLPAVS